MSDDNVNPENTQFTLEQACDELFAKDQDLRTALEVIVAAYRIHHIATLAIERIIAAEGLPAAAAKTLTSAGANKAKGSYYSMETLFISVQDEVIPFLKSEFQVQAEIKRTHDLETQLADRTSSTKPPIAVKMGEVTVELERGRVMLVVGDKVKLVKGLADTVYDFAVRNQKAMTQGNPAAINVINLSVKDTPTQIKQQEARIMRIPLVKWRYLANSHAKLKMLLYSITAQLDNEVCDLIVVDDGNQLFNGVHGREPSYDLEDGLRPLRRIATELNAGVVCLAPIPEDCPDYVSLLKSHLQQHTEYVEV